MSDPRRMIEHGASKIERTVLRSAQADVPPPGSADKISAALCALPNGGAPKIGDHGPGSTGLPADHAVPLATSPFRLGVLAKVGLVASIGLGGLGTILLVHAPSSSPPRSVARALPPAVRVEAPESLHVAAPVPAMRSPGAREPRPFRSRPPVVGESLGAELRLLDMARAALDKHETGVAERVLGNYARRFPHGRLEPEATVLRLTVLVRQGHAVEARQLARRLLASDGYATYEPRIRALLKESERGPGL
jgi:hypothetical protein